MQLSGGRHSSFEGMGHCVVHLLLVTLFVFQGINGKAVPSLVSNIPPTTPTYYSFTFKAGQKTREVINKLPSCIILHEAGSFLKLVNVRTGLTVGHHGKFDNSKTGRGVKTDAQWDFGTYPKLKTSFAGLYRCRTDTANSTQSYLLNVTAPVNVAVPTLISEFRPSSTSYWAHVFHQGQITSNITDLLPSCLILKQASSYLELYNVDNGFVAARHGEFTSYTSLSWNDTAYPVLEPSLSGLYRCRTATANSTESFQLNVTSAFVRECENFTRDEFSPSSPPSTTPDTEFAIKCSPNYIQNHTVDNVTDLTCQSDGNWTAFPTCSYDYCHNVTCPNGSVCLIGPLSAYCSRYCESSNILSPCDVNATCNIVNGSTVCTCPAGFTGNGTQGNCVPSTPTTVTTTANTALPTNMPFPIFPTPVPFHPPVTHKHASGLGGGAKAGIAFGVIAVFVLTGIFYYCSRKKSGTHEGTVMQTFSKLSGSRAGKRPKGEEYQRL